MGDELIEQLRQEGRLDSEGVFTSNDPASILELSQRLNPQGDFYFYKAVQGFVSGGCESLLRSATFFGPKLAAQGKQPGPLELCPGRWVSQAFGRNTRAAERHCALAILGAWPHCSQIELSWGTLHWLFEPRQSPNPQLLPASSQPPFFRFQRGVFPGLTLERLYACPIPLLFGSAPMQPNLYGPSFGDAPCQWWRGDFWVAMGWQAGPLPIPEWGTHPVFLTAEQPEVPGLSRSNFRWRGVRRLFCLANDTKERGLVIPVDAGVALDPIAVPLGIAGLRCLVSVEAEGLRTDLGQFGIVRDAAWRQLVESLARQGPEMVEQMGRSLESWNPPLTFHNGTLTAGMAGLTGGILAGAALSLASGATAGLCLLGLPLGAGLAALATRRWRAQARKHLRRLSDP